MQTPAKLNLFLEVLARRDDGFHEITTLMTAVNIYDSLVITECTQGQLTLSCEWASGMEAHSVSRATSGLPASLESLPKDSDNLVSKAIERLRVRAGIDAGASIRLVKRIPSAAGLGGASSDAAAALLAANQLWNLGWSRQRLREVAAELGSDIPFFLGEAHSQPAAICRGRGERLEPLTRVPRLHFVVVKPPAGLGTGAVYQACRISDSPASVDDFSRTLQREPPAVVGPSLTNRLQAAAEDLSPWIARVRRTFESLGCCGHQMSGSGTSYFGICRDARHARRMRGRVRALGVGQTFYATMAPLPVAVALPH